MKGFICLGNNSYVNLDFVDKGKSHYDKEIDKFVLVDIYGNEYRIEKRFAKNKLWKMRLNDPQEKKLS